MQAKEEILQSSQEQRQTVSPEVVRNCRKTQNKPKLANSQAILKTDPTRVLKLHEIRVEIQKFAKNKQDTN